MERISDAKTCLIVSESMLTKIKEIYNDNMYRDDLPNTIKVQIKNFLDNVRSSLDYVANYIFYTYCALNYTEKELKHKKVYFPIRNDNNYFNKCINKDFRGLSSMPNILSVFENNQSFNGQNWTYHLSLLSNKNKHIKLTRHKRSESGTLDYMEDIFGNKFINNTFVNCTHAIMYNDTPINSKNAITNPYIKTFIGNIDIEYSFEDTGTPIIQTLVAIYNGASLLVKDIERII